MSRIFISHSSQNNAHALALRDWLIGEGWDDLFLDLDPDRGIVAGERWERALSEAATRCEVVLFLVSREWLASGWCLKEFRLANKLNKRMFGLLVDGLTIPELPAEIARDWQMVDLGSGRDHATFRAIAADGGAEEHVTFSRSGLARLKAGLNRAGLDPKFFAWPPESDPDRPPYRGLKALEAEDAGIFFGREASTIAALDRLRGLRDAAAPRFLAILGASGAGKSSFLRAGILPRLARDDRNFCPLPAIRPERAAITGETGLLRSLTAALGEARLGLTRAQIQAAITDGAAALSPLLEKLANAKRLTAMPGEPEPEAPALVLAIDQAEELFLAEGAAEGLRLLQLLKNLVTTEPPRLIVVAAIRSDSYERLQAAPELEGIRQETFSLPPLPRGSYESVIEGPAKRLSQTPRPLLVEPALTQALLADIETGGAKDALPLLAFTLERLYVDHGGDGDLTLAEYRQTGGVKGSIEAAVERAMTAADADPRVPKDRLTRLVLMRRALIPWLAGIDPETGSPRRRVARLAEIPEEAHPIVDHLVAARLLSTDVGESGETTIEPAHEALLRQWGMLEGWLQEDFGLLSTLEGVKRAARDWNANAKGDDWLAHQGERLAEAQNLDARPDIAAKLDPDDRAYLAQCRAQQERERAEAEARRQEREEEQARRLADAQSLAAANHRVAARTRVGMVAALILAVIAGVVGVVARQERQVAVENSDLAARKTQEAEAAANDAKAKGAEAEKQRAAADKARADNLVAEAKRIGALSQQFANSNQTGLALGATLAAAPTDATDPRPLTPPLDMALRRSIDLNRQPIERYMDDNVFTLALSPDGKFLAAGTAGDVAKGWVHILDSTDLSELFRFKASEDVVSSLDFSPDGDRIVAAGGKIPVVWSVSARKQLFTLDRPDAKRFAKSAVFSADGKQILVGTGENRALLHDGQTGKFLFALPGSTYDESAARMKKLSQDGFGVADPIVEAVSRATFQIFGAATDAVFSPDGKLAAVSGQANPDASVRLYDVATGKLVRILAGGSGSPFGAPMGYGRTLWFTADSAKVIASPLSKTIEIWNVKSGKLETELDGVGLETFSLTPDDGAVVIGFSDGRLVLRCISGAFRAASFRAHDQSIEDVTIGNGLFATGSRDHTARLWSLPNRSEACDDSNYQNRPGEQFQQPIATLAGHTARVSHAIVSRDGGAVFTASQDGFVRKYKIVAPDMLELPAPPKTDESEHLSGGDIKFTVSSDARRIFVYRDFEWAAFSLDTTEAIALPQKLAGVAAGVNGSPALLFSGPFDVFGETDPPPPKKEDEDLFSLTLGDEFIPSPDGATVVAPLPKENPDSFESGPRALFDRKTKTALVQIDQDKVKPERLFYSPDGARLFGVIGAPFDLSDNNPGGSILVWNTTSGSVVARFDGLKNLGGSTEMSVSRDGQRLLLPADSPQIFDTSTQKAIAAPQSLQVNHGGISRSAVAIMPDGNRLIAGYEDGTVRVVAIDGGGADEIFYTRGVAVATLAVAPDGRFIAALDKANTLWIFDRESRSAARSTTWAKTVSTFTFAPDSRRLVVSFGDGSFQIGPAMATAPGLDDPRDLSDWARAIDLASISDDDAARYDFGAPVKVRSAKLEAVPSFAVPPRRFETAPGAKAEECDKLAGDPFDRERPSGARLPAIDAAAARPVCADALAQYPDDLPTVYHMARVRERAGETGAAATVYKSLADKSYAAAMRELARLIDAKTTGLADAGGTSAEWRDRATQAGDTLMLFDAAARVAHDQTRPASVATAFGMLDAAGVKNRASAARAIYLRLVRGATSDQERASALFYGFLAQTLERSIDDPAPAAYPRDRIDAREFVQDTTAALPAPWIVQEWREARNWLADMR